MKVTYVRVENFRAHVSTEVPLTQLGCLIGENNAGKSSILHAVQFALEDRKIEASDFKEKSLPVTVTLHLTGITDTDLQRVGETHRAKVAGIITDGTLKIVRTQEPNGRPESKYLKLVPIDSGWDIEVLNEATKGTTGVGLRNAAIELKPELEPLLSSKPSKADVVNAWQKLISDVPNDKCEEQPAPFPTGIAAAVKPLFPSVIYIEAVKDASVEAKSTGTSAFAKLLGMLFDEVQGQFDDIDKEFKKVHQKLSRQLDEHGDPSDKRLPAVKRIESIIEDYVTLSFPGVKIRMDIPAPTLPMLLASADLLVDDGHVGSVATKGDGLKRTVLFALLRAYTNMKDTGLSEVPESGETEERPKSKRSYLLLFEEPELYLHPRAQRQLMNALMSFSQDHQVLVTTHSPGFFQPGTKGFTRLYKTAQGVTAQPVDLEMSLRDEYQVVRHENNEAAFFAQRVVLVEGDSDTFVYPHLAKLLSDKWDDVERNIMFVKIEGKGNITRYRRFFGYFDIPIHVITDLDALSNGFSQLTSTQMIKDAHAKLMELVSECITGPSEPNGKKSKAIAKSRSARELWIVAQQHLSTWRDDKTESSAQGIEEVLTELFETGHGDAKLELLKNPPSDAIKEAIDEVVSSLACEGTYVLRRGDLEAYCGTSASSDKVSTAIRFCADTTSLDLFTNVHGDDAENVTKELRGIFSNIYQDSVPATT
ncbi:energy-coupling factor transporter ATP-binding protein EcfA2 [Arthrobacter stackebrandtii]|uniref:Energy-coupling factor transporter ATP-binding protein EcfA2 n=1 Tax=Arthrobacter stackebrandtii TaxID=272161 RepID=A0ABS4YZN6_9MICC|nr:AAA family ATPase [Arthrobacter stackebrandtii]MBP2414262.1 energy-coupling factor transporter ATP-binding protein EcfA2 [Arthrobacter stackebrandtii]PYH01427.1 hypothetical protein CVV67_02680 [Arthrobacter stackebrandtii]